MEKSIDGVRLEIPEHSINGRSIELGERETNDHGEVVEAPERKLTLFALRLAVLVKAASGLGTLGFIWATVVLLGGFAIALEKKDFWCITVILLIEGGRIFSRSHELEWQHQATWSLAEAGRSSFRALKSSFRILLQSLEVLLRPVSLRLSRNTSDRSREDGPSLSRPLLSFSGWVFLSQNAGRVLYWLQLLAAAACVALSQARLAEQDFGQLQPDDPDKKNRKVALNMFYSLALAEALLFLAEKSYWEWKVSRRRLLEEVARECHLGDAGVVSIKRFFYDAYSKCIEGSIFDGLKMDLVEFSAELLGSSSRDEQLIGVRILLRFSTSRHFSAGTLRKLGTSTPVIDRLIEMLDWKNPAEEEIRQSAAVIVSKLAGEKQNALRLAGVPGAMESFSGLLYTGDQHSSSNSRPDEVTHLSAAAEDHAASKFLGINLLGLLILKKLANENDNCGKIGNTRGLLAKIIQFTGVGCDGERLGRRSRGSSSTEPRMKAMKRSLQVVKMLASTTGQPGKQLRHEISEIVFVISNIREILRQGEDHLPLQKLGIEILTSLAKDEAARERIGSTGGVIKELQRVFFAQRRTKAGEALTMLAMESASNCRRILREARAVERLVATLDDPVLGVNAARILANLCVYSGEHGDGDEDLLRLRGVTGGVGVVMKATMTAEKEHLEASLGLSTQVFKFMDAEEFADRLEELGIGEVDFAGRLLRILHEHDRPSIEVPRMRRFVVEIAIWMMNSGRKYAELLGELGMQKELERVAETTSELECFSVLSGGVGLSRDGTALFSLVDTALEMMAASRRKQELNQSALA